MGLIATMDLACLKFSTKKAFYWHAVLTGISLLLYRGGMTHTSEHIWFVDRSFSVGLEASCIVLYREGILEVITRKG